jgi:translation initiation factor IF-3
MSKPIFIDYNIVNFDKADKQREMDNKCCVIIFKDKKITINVDKYDYNKLQISKSSIRGTDVITIEPHFSNSVIIS